MSNRAAYQVAGTEMALRNREPSTVAVSHEYSSAEQAEKEQVEKLMVARKRYGVDRQNKQREWTESFKMYMSWIDTALNPFLSNLFIPKTHEAVELLSAFLIGNNQSIHATAENGSSTPQKATVAARWLDWMWRKVLKARLKILIWIKQAVVFGNGVMKVGWDVDNNSPWMEVRPIEDIYFDYWMPQLQDSEYVFDEIRRTKDEVMNDEKYDMIDEAGTTIRSQVITGGPEGEGFATTALFNTFDGSIQTSQCAGKVLVLEGHCNADNTIVTLLPTSLGWRIAREKDNPNFYKLADGAKLYFRPFVKLRFKPSPVPNRAYDMSAVYPTIKIQRSFNDLINEYFDAVVQLGSPMWLKRRGARINPMELVRRPGGVITVSNIDTDLRKEVVGDVPNSIIEMLNRLDSEFEQASMVVNLLKGVSESDTATGDQLAQQNVQTLLDMINENIVDGLSELGQMIFAIAQENTEGLQTIKLFETDQEVGMLEFDPADISGVLDIIIRPDRDVHGPIAVQQAQLLEFAGLLRQDPQTLSKYPGLMEKIYKRWLENGGVADSDYFFTADARPAPPTNVPAGPKESIAINYKDAPPDIQRQIEKAAGFTPSQMGSADTGTGSGGPIPSPFAKELPPNVKQISPIAMAGAGGGVVA